VDEPAAATAEARALRFLDRAEGEDPFALRRELEELMWRQVGLVRDEAGLRDALTRLDDLTERADRVATPGGRLSYNLAWAAALDLDSLLTVARLTARAALHRRESRGSHYRADLPDPDPAWLRNVLQRGEELWTEPVRFTRLHPDSA